MTDWNAVTAERTASEQEQIAHLDAVLKAQMTETCVECGEPFEAGDVLSGECWKCSQEPAMVDARADHIGRWCLCPSDCGCKPYTSRSNVCGCRAHE